MYTFDVIPDDGETFRVKAMSRDVARWEAGGPDRAVFQVETTPRMADLVEIAYHAARRRELYTGSLADFRAQCDVVPIPKSEAARGETPDPTHAGH